MSCQILSETYLSQEEVAKVLAVSVPTIRRLTSEGGIASIKIGKMTRIPVQGVVEYLEGRNIRVQPADILGVLGGGG